MCLCVFVVVCRLLCCLLCCVVHCLLSVVCYGLSDVCSSLLIARCLMFNVCWVFVVRCGAVD